VVDRPLFGYKFGSEGDAPFIKEAAQRMWGVDILATHSVTGKTSNANKKKNGEEAEIECKPPLENFKIQAIQGKLIPCP